LNAVLRLYNITAIEGQRGSLLKRLGGLYYQVLDEHGKRIGVPIKASLFTGKPTLKRLESHFLSNSKKKQDQKLSSRLLSSVNWALMTNARSVAGFINALHVQNVKVLVTAEQDVKNSKLVFIDLKSKAVFEERELTSLQSLEQIRLVLLFKRLMQVPNKTPLGQRMLNSFTTSQMSRFIALSTDTIQILPAAIDDTEAVPFELKRKKKLRKRW